MRFRRGPVVLGSADNAIRLSSQPRLMLQEAPLHPSRPSRSYAHGEHQTNTRHAQTLPDPLCPSPIPPTHAPDPHPRPTPPAPALIPSTGTSPPHSPTHLHITTHTYIYHTEQDIFSPRPLAICDVWPIPAQPNTGQPSPGQARPDQTNSSQSSPAQARPNQTIPAQPNRAQTRLGHTRPDQPSPIQSYVAHYPSPM
ncbi:uncharacterized protein LOC135103277 [Scylla paramamosain]|uniref:uncharacterized protein LOC135103277 n=1 Tax=Scylla paramamosain TaxID=85552 RepID=UPI003082AC46